MAIPLKQTNKLIWSIDIHICDLDDQSIEVKIKAQLTLLPTTTRQRPETCWPQELASWRRPKCDRWSFPGPAMMENKILDKKWSTCVMSKSDVSRTIHLQSYKWRSGSMICRVDTSCNNITWPFTFPHDEHSLIHPTGKNFFGLSGFELHNFDMPAAY